MALVPLLFGWGKGISAFEPVQAEAGEQVMGLSEYPPLLLLSLFFCQLLASSESSAVACHK